MNVVAAVAAVAAVARRYRRRSQERLNHDGVGSGAGYGVGSGVGSGVGLVDDGRTTQQVYADPDTPEADIVARGIRTREELAAVLGREHMSARLIGEMIVLFVTTWDSQPSVTANLDDDDAADTMIALTREPELTAKHLDAMAVWYPWRNGSARQRLVMAVCTHPLATTDTVVGALWDSSSRCARDVAVATGSLAATATVWARTRARTSQFQVGYATRANRDSVAELEARWEARVGGDHALRSFLITNSHLFTDEDEMFAAGAAVVAPPPRW